MAHYVMIDGKRVLAKDAAKKKQAVKPAPTKPKATEVETDASKTS